MKVDQLDNLMLEALEQRKAQSEKQDVGCDLLSMMLNAAKNEIMSDKEILVRSWVANG